MNFQIVFNLYPAAEHVFLPNAYIVQTDAAGLLTHIFQKASLETVSPYSIKVTAAHERLFQVIERLTPKNLEARFRPPKSKTAVPLTRLLSDADTKPVVEGFIYRQLDEHFFPEITANRFPLTWDAEKKTLAKDLLIALPKEELVPHLHFKKTPTGVEYRLQLGTEDEKWRVRERDVQVLTNTQPAWVFVDYTLFRVPGINGKMLLPFQKKDVLEIPEKNVREYFKKIVVRSANRTQIEPEGFDLQLREGLLYAELRLGEDIFHQNWLLTLLFQYEGRSIEYGEKRERFTWVEFPEGQPIEVHQIRRDPAAEAACLSFLKKLGLREENRNLHFPSENGQTGFEASVRWLAQHRNVLENKGFRILAPELEGKTLALHEASVRLQSKMQNDWFDVHGVVVVGPFEFPFKKLVPYIRRQERFFPLPDGTFFPIPEEWLARYSELVRTATEGKEDALRLPKTLFPLLDALGLGAEMAEFPVIDPEKVEFEMPQDLQASLRPYQLFGVKWLVGHHQHGFGACLADDMGLGKTLQTIAVLLWARAQKKANAEKNATSSDLQPTIPENLPAENPVLEKTAPNPPKKVLSKRAGADFGLQLDLFGPPPPPLLGDPLRGDNSYGVTKKPDPYWVTKKPDPYWVTKNPETFKTLIILPASLVFNWRAELLKFAPNLFVLAHTGATRVRDPRVLSSYDIVLTTYHTARNDLDLLGKIEWDYLVLDESQQIKNRESEISKVVRALRGAHKISLSGTPIENSLADLWTQMEFINPATLGSFHDFKTHFIAPIERSGDEAAKNALFRRVRPFFLRRTKEEVAPDLPELSEQVFYSEMSPAQKSLYEKTKSAVRNQLLALFSDPRQQLLVIQQLMRLRQIANHPALVAHLADAEAEAEKNDTSEESAILEALENLSAPPENAAEMPSGKFDDVLAQLDIVRRSGHKVLVFSFFEKYLRLFRARFEAEKIPFAWLTGQTAPAERPAEIRRFQEDPAVQVFFMTTKAGGVGLNLTAAEYVFLLDPWWNPAVEEQAIARAHRIGQTARVTAIRFIAKDSIEEKIRDLQERKRLLGEAFFRGAGEEVPRLTREDVEHLLE